MYKDKKTGKKFNDFILRVRELILAEIKNNLGVIRMETKKSLHELTKHI